MQQAKTLLLATWLLPSLSFAFFCPNNFKQIDYGYTIDQVVLQCGKPDKMQEVKQPNENVPQEWTYYVPQSGSITPGLVNKALPTSKVQISFDSEGRAVNMLVNNVPVGTARTCNNTQVQIGSSRDQIKASCGTPTFVTRQATPVDENNPTPESIIITTFVYNANPPVRLIFENGRLKERR